TLDIDGELRDSAIDIGADEAGLGQGISDEGGTPSTSSVSSSDGNNDAQTNQAASTSGSGGCQLSIGNDSSPQSNVFLLMVTILVLLATSRSFSSLRNRRQDHHDSPATP
ncbi:MAG: hypothetical protein D6820_03990, partial [Lentisphaerae bacterium]